MPPPSAGSSGQMRLDDLIALNDEIAALVRAGVPLERGLDLVGGDLPGRLGQLTERLSRRMSRGKSLPEAITDEGSGLPQFYRAVVQAGMRSGQLAIALEGLSSSLRRIAELRRFVGIAWLYPLFVFLVAWGLFCFFVVVLNPRFATFDVMGHALPLWLSQIRDSAMVWGPLLPLLCLLAYGTWWMLSGRAVGAELGMAGGWLGWIPSVRKMRQYGCAATFAEVLSLLMDRHIPLAETLRLAADASQDRKLGMACQRVAASIERGQDLAEATRGVPHLPPFLCLAVYSDARQAALASAARSAAKTYHRRAELLADWVQFYFPVVLTATIGGIVTLTYALLLFWPWAQSLRKLASM